MKKWIAVIALILCPLLIAGCASCFPDMKIMQAEKQGAFYIGMSEQEVFNIVGRQPNLYADIWRTENNSDGQYQLWVVNGSQPSLSLMRTCYFKFKDGKLASWGNQ